MADAIVSFSLMSQEDDEMSAIVSQRLTRRQMLKFTGGIGVAAALTACAPAAPAPAPAPQEQPAAEEPAAAEPAAPEQPSAEKTSIRFWSHQNIAFVAADEAQVKKYMELHPEVEVKLETFPYEDFIQTIQTGMAAKNEADIIEMFGSWVPAYTKGGTLSEAPADMMTYAQAQDLYFAAPLDAYQRDGKLYGFPSEYNIENGGVLVNKRMFEEDGLTYPPEWASWDAVTADGAKLARGTATSWSAPDITTWVMTGWLSCCGRGSSNAAPITSPATEST
jgi:ABC-type glycerol-3-phosphate transport system substrate-binding protein